MYETVGIYPREWATPLTTASWSVERCDMTVTVIMKTDDKTCIVVNVDHRCTPEGAQTCLSDINVDDAGEQ